MADLLIGLVTHARSRFLDSAGPHGAVARIAAAVSGDVTTLICDEDLFDDEQEALTHHALDQSTRDYSAVQREWVDYLAQGHRSAFSRHFYRAWGRARLRAAQVVHADSTTPQQGMSSLTRLLNIELAHLSLMQTAVDCGAHWTLIIEDDATCTEPLAIAKNLDALMTLPSDERPWLVNLSCSFTPRELGTAHLLRPAPFTWQGDITREVLTASRPVTNTVCANLYSGDFLPTLLERWRALPMVPVVPIDWKLNRILMDMHRTGEFPAERCWTVEPGPLVQGSLHASASNVERPS